MAAVPSIDLGNGVSMPVIGLGTWKSKVGEVQTAVEAAIDAGYRHIDCAFIYGNEAEVGAALCNKFSQGVVKREDLFIVSKLWNTYHAPEYVRIGVKKSLELLKLDYLDCYLIHWPTAWQAGEENFPRDESGNLIYSDTHPTETYKAMEKLVEEGLLRSIGLSNFNTQQVQHVLDNATIKPATLQVEVHPYFPNCKLVDFCQSRGIAVTAFSPLGSPDRPWASPDEPVLLDDPTLKAIACKYGKTSAQVVLRWVLQRNLVVLPKSVTPSRIKENFDIFDFELSRDDMEVISNFNKGIRLVAPYVVEDGKRVFRDKNAPNFPFLID